MANNSSSNSAGGAPTMTAAQYFDMGANDYEKGTGGCTRELARWVLTLPQLSPLFEHPADAIVLDNACGSGIVAEEILLRLKGSSPPLIHAVDAAPNMVALAQAKLAALMPADRLSTAVNPGEKLEAADEMFTHSITNMGLMFFHDAIAGAREIHRTLRTDGIAIVTTWADLGYLDAVIRPAQKAARPDDAPYAVPIPLVWFDPSHVKQVLTDAGFASVEILERVVHFGARTVEELAVLQIKSFTILWKDWSESEQAVFKEAVLKCLKETVVEYAMVGGEKGVGVEMKAIVAVCKK